MISRLLCRGPDSWANRACHSRLPLKLHRYRSMSSRSEYYRRRGLEAQQRAAQTTEPKIRDAFEIVVESWFELAEQLDCLDRRGQPTACEADARCCGKLSSRATPPMRL